MITRVSLLLTFLCFSCVYKAEPFYSNMQVRLNIDGCREDTSLIFQQALIRKLAVNNITVGSSHLEMALEMINVSDENIGYSFDHSVVSGAQLPMLYPDELRESLLCCVSIYDQKNKEYLLDPKVIEVFVDADFSNPTDLSEQKFNISSNSISTTTLEFSLGQFTDRESALRTLKNPLYKKLVEEIMDLIDLRVKNAGK